MTIERVENSMFGSSTWVLGRAGEGTWLVDCGDVAPLLLLIVAPLRGVLLTHVHFDHIYGLNELLSRFPAARIVTNAVGREALLDEYQNLSAYHDAPFRLPNDRAIEVVGEGDAVPLFGDVAAHVYATPGHHPSCLTYAVGSHLFTGDAYIPGVKVVTILPGGDKREAAASLERIARLAAGRLVHPGHGIASPWR